MRNLVGRFVVTCAALSVLFAGAGAAIAHGFAHHEAAAHAAEHAVESARAPHGMTSVSSAEHDGTHLHTALTPAAPSSVAKGGFATRAEQIALPSDEHVMVVDAAAANANESPPDTSGRSPSRSRAPPVL